MLMRRVVVEGMEPLGEVSNRALPHVRVRAPGAPTKRARAGEMDFRSDREAFRSHIDMKFHVQPLREPHQSVD